MDALKDKSLAGDDEYAVAAQKCCRPAAVPPGRLAEGRLCIDALGLAIDPDETDLDGT
jgi:hypothetical protein